MALQPQPRQAELPARWVIKIYKYLKVVTKWAVVIQMYRYSANEIGRIDMVISALIYSRTTLRDDHLDSGRQSGSQKILCF